VRASLAAGLLIFSLFGVIDRYAAPLHLASAWLYRFGVGSTSLLLALLSTYGRASRRWTQPAICLGAIGAGLGVVLHIRQSAPSESAHSHYYVGLILTMMFTGSWVRLRFWYTLLANAAILGLYGGVVALGQRATYPPGQLLVTNAFLFAAACIALLTSYFLEVNSRVDYLQRNALEAEQTRSMRQRQALEQQAQELARALDTLQATQAQLVQREKLASLGELTAGIAHELQNPLNFVTNFADVSAELLDELAEEHAQPTGAAGGLEELVGMLRQNLLKIRQHGHRAGSIVRNMLAHSRPSLGERQPTDLNALCGETLQRAYQEFQAKHPGFAATLLTQLDPQLPRTPVVGGDISRVVLNLYSNALYAVRQRQQRGEPGYEPTVGVATHCRSGEVEIQVQDNGVGMSEPVQAKVFQPFFTTKPAGEGTGLGLSLSYEIITHGHGGTLTVDSQEGQGSTFWLRLPVTSPV
jgi:signal transduction histidine kinase